MNAQAIITQTAAFDDALDMQLWTDAAIWANADDGVMFASEQIDRTRLANDVMFALMSFNYSR